MEIKFHGHACFELSDGDTTVLVDPFLAPNNPKAVASAEDVEPTHIAISHGHADHIADAAAVAKRTGAHCIAVPEILNWLGSQGADGESTDPNLGGTVEFDWGYVALVPAWHTNSTPDGTAVGVSNGLLVKIGETTAYHTGDTCLFGDMKLIAERSDVNVALLPIGGHYTMDRRDAVVAAELIGAPTVIPMHYDTFPPIETDVEAFKSEVEEKTSSSVVILQPGETHST
jgi:L-ascorbate metabolism protein UlaG (beta-lactamase superfamily)